MIKVTKLGVEFPYHGDVVTYLWPWSKSGRYKSSLYSCDFNNFREYWKRIGSTEYAIHYCSPKGKVQGFRIHEILCDYVSRNMLGRYVVVLCDINASARDSTFWSRMPKHQAEQLTKDIAIFTCDSRAQMLDITTGTPTDFATSYAIEGGVLVESNLWGD